MAHEAGYETIDLGADLEGEAREVAAEHARLALDARARKKRMAILSGGDMVDPDPELNELEQQGRVVFNRACGTCHGGSTHPTTGVTR